MWDKLAFQSERDGNSEIYLMDPDGSNQTRLTNDGAVDLWPSWSSDGSQIVFSSNRDGDYEIFVMDADGSNQTQLTDNMVRDAYPAWASSATPPSPAPSSPGNIAFKSTRDGNPEIYVMAADGSGQTRLTSEASNDESPAISPDGSKVIFSSQRGGSTLDFYLKNIDGSGEMKRLTENPYFVNHATWCSDDSIAFASFEFGAWEIFVSDLFDLDGPNKVRLTTSSGATTAACSPDGTKVAYGRGGSVYVVSSSGGGGETLVSTAGGGGSMPSWSPDGLKIAYDCVSNAQADICVKNADGSGSETTLTNHPANDNDPSWSPDGKAIVFTSERGGGANVYVMNADGTGVSALTTVSGNHLEPSWGITVLAQPLGGPPPTPISGLTPWGLLALAAMLGGLLLWRLLVPARSQFEG